MKKILFLIIILIGSFACTNLEEELRSSTAKETTEADPAALLTSVYTSMRLPFQDQSRWWAAQEHTSDETLGPTRGPDWDDNGIWRSLHSHTWSPDHAFLSSTFTELLQSLYAANVVIEQESATAQQKAEARMIRAFLVQCVLDGWGQVPWRPEGSSLLEDAQVLDASQAVTLILDEADRSISDLPSGPSNVANKDAAKVLKMKTLLNKGMYLDRANPTFDNGDMQTVVSLADELISSGKYSLATNYFDNFAPNNDQISTENIWTAENVGGSNSGNVRSRWYCTLHYNQNPSGWNGFTTLSDFYDSFEDSDVRKGASYDGVTDVSGIKVGFLEGQQYDKDGNALQDRKGNALAFKREVALKESGNDLEITGIRVVKYPIDYNSGDNANNDYVYYRYADVLLMKAEAQFRLGNTGDALSIVNDIRSARGASELSSLSADDLINERGRELYWEGHRRTDLLRFGKFLDSWQQKSESGLERLLFPIPAASVASNPNLTQNPGY